MNLLAIILISVVLAFFFAGVETAFIAANKLQLEIDKQSHPVRSKLLGIITSNTHRFSFSMNIGITLAITTFGISMWYALLPFLHEHLVSLFVSILFGVGISSLVVFTFVVIIPETFFRMMPNQFLNVLLIPASFVYFMMFPFAIFFAFISNSIHKYVLHDVSSSGESYIFSRVDWDEFVSGNDNRGSTNKDNTETEVKLFKNALDFTKVKLREIMIPRNEIEMLDIQCSVEEMRQKFIETGYSRIIFYDQTIDNIVGYVHSSVLFKKPTSIKPFLTNVIIVPETMPANKLLGTFIREHRNMAIVVDEFGGTSGMVTSEDILEEIFGEIEDEHDTIDFVEKKISDTEFIFSGRVDIDHINEKYELDIPEAEDYETLAGFILYNHESIPKINSVVKIGKFQFKILKATNTKIELARLTISE